MSAREPDRWDWILLATIFTFPFGMGILVGLAIAGVIK